MTQFHGNVSGKHVHGDGSWSTAPTIVSITPGATSISFTYTGGATHYRIFPLAGSPGAWVLLSSSPTNITGLTTNTEYTLQVSGDGVSLADTENTGTTNPGSGGGEVEPGTWVTGSIVGQHTATVSASVQVVAPLAAVTVSAAIVGQHSATVSAQVAVTAGVAVTAAIVGVHNATIMASVSVQTAPPPAPPPIPPEFETVRTIPSIAIRRNGERLIVRCDAEGVPYEAVRSNGAVIQIRPLSAVLAYRAVTEAGELLTLV